MSSGILFICDYRYSLIQSLRSLSIPSMMSVPSFASISSLMFDLAFRYDFQLPSWTDLRSSRYLSISLTGSFLSSSAVFFFFCMPRNCISSMRRDSTCFLARIPRIRCCITTEASFSLLSSVFSVSFPSLSFLSFSACLIFAWSCLRIRLIL